MRRVPAFTLIEMLLSLILVVILGTFATMAMGDSVMSSHDLAAGAQQEMELLLLDQRVRLDMERAITAQHGPEEALVLTCDDEDIIYRIEQDSLVRSCEGTRQVFAVPARSIALQDADECPGLLETWSVEVEVNGTQRTLFFRKDYDARTRSRYAMDHGDTDN